MSKNVIVVGAGASGLMAAIKAAEYGGRVTILEQNGLPGRKLLVTGNGRCNLTNTNQSRECYHCSNSFFPLPAIAAFGQQETVQFFSKLGIYTVNRGGYLYPHSGQASQVLGVLTMEAKARGIKIRCNTGVKAVTRMNPGQHKDLPEGGYAVRVEGYTYYCDALILANGSPASSVEGACDSGYALAKSLGHTIIRPEPALVPLVTREKYPWHGVRTEGKVTLYVENTSVAESEGELQLTSYGISGIPVFQVSREAARALGDGQSVTACLDFFPDFDPESFERLMDARQTNCPYKSERELFVGIFPDKLIDVLMTQKNPRKAAKNLRLTVTGTGGFEKAQVCSGGVLTDEVDPFTMQSWKSRNLFFSGEILDVDGICGGYNLQWAWSSGAIAGRHAAEG